jgi:hypothetical protein
VLANLLDMAAAYGAACFAAGTPILTDGGWKPIEDVRPGDRVLSAPEDDPDAPPVYRFVEETFQRYSPVMELRVGGRTILTTAEHPFWVDGKGWVDAQQLRAGDLLRTHDGRLLPIEEAGRPREAAPVYNMRVAEYHTYFIGCDEWGFGVWAHNAGGYGPVRAGQAGEAAAGITKTTGSFGSLTGKRSLRIPDEYIPGVSITEVKNVAKLHLSSQIRDYMYEAMAQSIPFILRVRRTTLLTPQIQELIRRKFIILGPYL